MIRTSSFEPAVVVLGVSRSGTTLLREMLNRHSRLAIPPESYFLPPLWDRWRSTRDLERLLSDLGVLVRLREWGIAPAEVRGRIPADADFPDVVRAVYALYAESRGKDRFGDKTPIYLRHLALLEHAFGRPLYLHIVRDGRDAALSWSRMPLRPDGWEWPGGTAEFACRWRSEIEAARRFAAAMDPGRYVEIRYEDLVADPRVVLEHVCDRIGLAFEAAMLEYHRHVDPADPRLVNNEGLRRPPSLQGPGWRGRMPPAEVERFEAIAGELLVELGYERGCPRPGAAARARARVARAATAGKILSLRTATPLVRRSPLWRWRQVRELRRAGYRP